MQQRGVCFALSKFLTYKYSHMLKRTLPLLWHVILVIAKAAGVRHVNLDTPHCKTAVFPKTVHLGTSPEETPSRLKLADEAPEQEAESIDKHLRWSNAHSDASKTNWKGAAERG